MNTFFKRLLQVIEYEKFKNLNDFALNGLKYESSSKLNRLKHEDKKPSVEILEDIANKFQNINLHWLVTGRGNMLLEKSTFEYKEDHEQIFEVNEPNNNKDLLIATQAELIKFQRDKISQLETELLKNNK